MALRLTFKEALEHIKPDLDPGFELVRAEHIYMAQTDEIALRAIFKTPVGPKYTSQMVTEQQIVSARGMIDVCEDFYRTSVEAIYQQVMQHVLGDAKWEPYLQKLFEQAQWSGEIMGGSVMGASTPEGRVKARLNKRLKELRLLWKYMPVPSGYGMQSLDYLLCVSGHFVAIETKAKGKRPTPRQEQTMAEIRAAGGLVFVVEDDASMDTCIGSLCLLTKVNAA